MMACNIPASSGIYEGELVLHQTGTRKKNKDRYGSVVAASTTGVARLEIYESLKHSFNLMPKFMILGSDIVKVVRIKSENKNIKNAFLISTRNDHYTFCVENTFKCDQWVKNISETLLGEVHGPRNEISMSEVNDLYESTEDFSSQISGYLVQTDGKTRAILGVDGEVRLVVENESISIITLSGKMVVRWGIKDIRKYSVSNKEFLVEAGRNSPVGEGKFVFLTDKAEKIKDTLNKKKNILKQKIKESSHTSPGSLPVTKHQPASSRSVPVASLDMIYETLEDVNPQINPQLKPPAKIDSQAMAVTSTTCTRSSSDRLGNKSSAVNQHSTNMATDIGNQNKPQQAEIYSEPQTIRNAWKSFGCEDNEDTAIYSNLSYSQQQENESHYWQGTTVRPSVHTEQKKEVQSEDIYAQVNFSAKSKKAK